MRKSCAKAVKCRSVWGGPIPFGGTTGGVVLPVAGDLERGNRTSWIRSRDYQQTLHESRSRQRALMADPYWGVSSSRRWQLFERVRFRIFDSDWPEKTSRRDLLSATRWDFLHPSWGCAFGLPGNRAMGELTMRHWSNAASDYRTTAQDFATLTIRLNRGYSASVQLTIPGRPDIQSRSARWRSTNPPARRVFTMSTDELEQMVAKARKLRELRRARERVRQLSGNARGAQASLRSQPTSPNPGTSSLARCQQCLKSRLRVRSPLRSRRRHAISLRRGIARHLAGALTSVAWATYVVPYSRIARERPASHGPCHCGDMTMSGPSRHFVHLLLCARWRRCRAALRCHQKLQ